MNKEKQHISHSTLMSYLLGEADSMQIDEVNAWLSVSEENAKYLKSLELLWIETGKLTPPPVAVDSLKAWKNVSSKLKFNPTDNLKIQTNYKNRFKFIWQAAAILIVLIGSYSIFKLMTGEIENKIVASGEQIISDTLSDGSIVSLNKNSSLVYPEKFKKKTRTVKLTGEAFFDIEPNKNQPFIIELNEAYVKVIGTSFNVKEIPEQNSVEVYVETGTVQLYSVNEERDTSLITLNKGEKGRLNTKTGQAEKSVNEGMNANDLSWFNQTFSFDGVKLVKVAGFLEKHYDIKIEFAKDTIQDYLLTANFKNDDIEKIITVIAESFNLQLNKKNQTYIFDEDNN